MLAGKKKLEKETDFKAHGCGIHGTWRQEVKKEEVLTGCPCGGCCLSRGLRMEVCVCTPIRMSVYVFSVLLRVFVCACVLLTGIAEERPTAPEVADI